MKGGRTRGFTLVELMVTLVLSMVIIGAVYALYAQSVSAYRVEGQVMDMQDRLRFGLEHLKRDLRRAGFLATPHSTQDPNVCPPPAHELRAVTLDTSTEMSYVARSDENEYVQPTAVTLFGDFYSGRVYRTDWIQSDRVTLQNTANYPASQVEFERIFDPHSVTSRYLRIVTRDQFEIYLPIVDTDYANRTIVVEDPVPVAGGGTLCGIKGFGEGLDVSVAGFVRYRILQDTRPNAPAEKSDLVREELQVDGQTVVPNSQLVIADYAVDLQFYDFGFDMDTTGTNPTLAQFPLVTDVADSYLANSSGARPHRLRYLTVKLTVRTMDEDPDQVFQPRRSSLFEPLRTFNISPMDGACHTYTLAARVELPSLAVRNLVGGTP